MLQRYRLSLLLLLLTALWWTGPARAAAPEAPQLPVRGYILIDHHTGTVLAEQQADERLEPASITKLMAAYVVYDALRRGDISMDDQVTISERAWRTEGSRMFVEVGSRVSVKELLLGMVVQSGNDATVALAEHVAGTEDAFAGLMNQAAQRLGLSASHFTNASGLPDPEHYTTARDIATLVQAVIREFPEHYAHYADKSYTYNGITQHNRNRLLWQDDSVDGVKTGHTNAAGYCLASSALRGDMRLTAVVLGAENDSGRTAASKSLLDYGFRFFETHRLYGEGEALAQGPVWKGTVDSVALGLDAPLYVTVPRGRHAELAASVELHPEIRAPFEAGTMLGTVNVALAGEPLAQAPLVALAAVEEAGMAGRWFDEARLFLRGLLD